MFGLHSNFHNCGTWLLPCQKAGRELKQHETNALCKLVAGSVGDGLVGGRGIKLGIREGKSDLGSDVALVRSSVGQANWDLESRICQDPPNQDLTPQTQKMLRQTQTADTAQSQTVTSPFSGDL